MNKRMIPNKDAVIKTTMEILFPDLLRFIFTNADDIFDFNEEIVFLDKELDKIDQGSSKGGARVLDKLARVKLKTGDYEHVLVLFEAEGRGRNDFAERMFIHYYRVRDKHGGKICSIALLTDRNTKFHPTRFAEECLGTSLSFTFNAIKIWGQNHKELEANGNPFSVVALTILAELERTKRPSLEIIKLGKSIAFNLNKRKIPALQRDALLAFLYNYINFEDPQIEAKFEYEINRITGKNKSMRTMSFLEMAEKGAVRTANLKIAKNLLKMGLSVKDISKCTGLSIYLVNKLNKQITSEV